MQIYYDYVNLMLIWKEAIGLQVFDRFVDI